MKKEDKMADLFIDLEPALPPTWNKLCFREIQSIECIVEYHVNSLLIHKLRNFLMER